MNKSPLVSKKAANTLGLLFVLLSIIGILYLGFAHIKPPQLIAAAGKLDNRTYLVMSFLILVLISQLLVVPSGSILLIGGGFLLGTIPAALIYTALLPITGVIAAEIAASSSLTKWVESLLYKSNKASRIARLLKHEPFTLSAVLRLTPVIPAAIAAIVATTLKVSHTTFIFATLCVGWIRPLFFASIGGAAQSMTQLNPDSIDTTEKSILPILLLALSAILNLLVRCWLRWKRESSMG